MVDHIYSFMAEHIAPTWSPDSQWLAILSAEHELILANVHSGEIRHLGITLNNPPQWSPDSSRLIFYTETIGPGVYTISLDNPEPRLLTPINGCCVPVWSHSGHFIAFPGDGLYVINADGTNAIKLEIDLLAPYPAWLPNR